MAEVGPERFHLQLSIVSSHPRIVMIGMDVGETGYKKFSDGLTSMHYLSKIVGKGGYVFINPWWSVVNDNVWARRLEDIRLVAKQEDACKFMFMCNTPEEVAYLVKRDFEAIVMSHNTFCNENVFNIRPSKKEFRAIYNAKMTPFKRHELATEVENLALVYSRFGDLDTYFPRVQKLLPNAAFLNGDPRDGSYKMFDSGRVAAALNRARVGLCLSKVEGAMYASIEYLLCGLCVVSTKSTGGRELFFDDSCCKIVDDNPAAVAGAVSELIAADIKPEYVREKALEKVNASRDRFVELVESIQVAAEQSPDGRGAIKRMMSVSWACWRYKALDEVDGLFV